MKVHIVARAPHLAAHMDAIWFHLPDELRGDRIVDTHARAPKYWDHRDVVMVAGYPDIFATGDRRTIYVEHGAGQSYVQADKMGAKNYFHGGEHPEFVIGYIGPRQSVIDAWAKPGFAAGAPICDPYELFAPDQVAVITFHNNPPAARYVPEMGTAFEHYHPRMGDIIKALHADGWTVLGHHHPRFKHMEGYWGRNFGIATATAHEVRVNAKLLIADNTSLAYEMTYLGRNVISMNAPWFRRDVEHGQRFWSHVPGIQVNDADELINVISEYNEIEPMLCDWSITEHVYGKAHSDGLDGLRAATWLTTFLASL